jgi:hypothetical protein
MNNALKKAPDLAITDTERKSLESLLNKNIRFMESCLKKGTYSLEDIEMFGQNIKPDVIKIVEMAASVQAEHWVKVLTEWKALVGSDWDKTYGMTNTLYVTRQNNILFTILAQFMGSEALNRRLILIETTAFTAKPEDMLNLLSRILNDRALGKAYFNDYMLMDTELLGSASRDALKKSLESRGKTPFFPEYARFDSNDWPWRTNPNFGTGARTIEETTAAVH